MADGNPTEAFEKKIRLALESTMTGVRGTVLALEAIKKHLAGAEKLTRDTGKATKDLSKTYAKTAKDVANLRTGFKGLKTVQKGLYETTRRIGSTTRTALGAATAAASAFFVESKRIGDTMLQFEVTSLDAANALNRLGSAYGDLRSQSSSAVLSMQDVAAELTKFQKQGIAQMSATMNEQFLEGWRGIQGVITQVLGKTNAGELMGSFVQSLGDEFKVLRTSIAGDLGVVAKKIQEAVDPQIKAGYIDDFIAKIKAMRVYTSDQGATAQMLIGTMTKLRDVTLGGGNDMTKAVIAINQAWAKLGTQVENFSTGLVETFGPDLAQMISNVAGRLQDDMGGILNRLGKYAEDLKDRFIAWGGTEKLIASLQRALDFVYKTLGQILGIGSSILTWIMEANTSSKILAASLASIVLAPGLITSVFTLGKGLKLVAIEGAAAAAAAKGFGGFAGAKGVAAGLAGRAAGVGLVAGVATIGHLGGKATAGYFGAEEGGTGEMFSGAAGAALAGAAIGSVLPGIGTAVGAAIGGIGSIVVTGIMAWRDDVKEVVELNYKKLAESEGIARSLKKQIGTLEQYAVSKSQTLELQEAQVKLQIAEQEQLEFSGKLTKLEAQPVLDKLRKQLADIADQKTEINIGIGSKDEAYVKKITEAQKKQAGLALKLQITRRRGLGDLGKEISLQARVVKQLREAAAAHSEINRLLKEQEEVSRNIDVSGTKRGASIEVLQAEIDKRKSKLAQLEVQISPGRSIDEVIAKVNSLRDMQSEGGFDFDSKEYVAEVRSVRKSYNELKTALTQVEGGQFDEQIKELDKLLDTTLAAGDGFTVFTKRLEDLKKFTARTLPGFTGAISGMVAIIETLGPATEMFGDQIARIMDKTSVLEMSHSFEVLRKASVAAAIEFEAIDLAKSPQEAAQHVRQLEMVLQVAAGATKTLQQSLEAGLEPLKKQLEMVSAIKDLRQLDLDISQQLYGTPALAVKAQLELVKTMQAQKENLEGQLAFTQDRIAQAKALHLSEQDIFFLRMKELALGKEIKSVIRDQLRAVKELRDGYIDAVVAQSFGASRFSKVLITQEQNLGRGLIEGIIKPNFLLGQAGAAAGASRADPYRFSAQGMGFLETLSGQTMRPEDIAKAVYDRVANISDPLSKASALQSADIFMNIMSGADKNTAKLGNVFMLGQDRVVDAINALAEQRLPRAAAGLALKGAPAGETLVGAAMDRGGRGLTLPPPSTGLGGLPFDAADYRRQVKQQQGSQDSIRALMEHLGGQGEATLPPLAGAPVRQIDPGKANTFFGQALPFYTRFESLLAKIAEGVGVDVTTIQNIIAPATVTTVPTGFGISSLSIRGAGQVGLSQAAPGDSRASKQLVDDLQRTDREVKRHEKTHQRVAGPFAEGSPSYTYQKGPDGRRYAVGGEVLVDLSPIPGDPQATVDKMRRIRAAALAPRHPSEQDLIVAKQAAQIEQRIQGSLPVGVLGVEPPKEPEISKEPQAMEVFRRLKGESRIPGVPETEELQVIKVLRRLRGDVEPRIPEIPEIEELQTIEIFRRLRGDIRIPEVSETKEFQAIKVLRRLREDVEPRIPEVSETKEFQTVKILRTLLSDDVVPEIPEISERVRDISILRTLLRDIEPSIPESPEVKELQAVKVLRTLRGETESRIPDEPQVEELQTAKVLRILLTNVEPRIPEISEVKEVRALEIIRKLRAGIEPRTPEVPDVKELQTIGIFRQLRDDIEPTSKIPEEQQVQKIKVLRRLLTEEAPRIPEVGDIKEIQAIKVIRRLRGDVEPKIPGLPEAEEVQTLKIFRKLSDVESIPEMPKDQVQEIRVLRRLLREEEPRIPEVARVDKLQALKIFHPVRTLKYYVEPKLSDVPEVEEPQVFKILRRLKDHVESVPEAEAPQALKIFHRLKDRVEPIIPDIPEAEEPQIYKILRPFQKLQRLEQGSSPIWLPGAAPDITAPDIAALDTHLSPMGLPLGAPASSIEITNLGKLVNVIGQSIKANRGNTAAVIRNVTAQADVSKTLKSGNFFKEVSAELKSTGQRLEKAKSALANTQTALPSKIDEIINARSAPGGQKPRIKRELSGKFKSLGMKDSPQVRKLQSEAKVLRRSKLTGQRAVDMLSKRQARVGRIKEVGRAARAAMPGDYRVRDIATNLRRIPSGIREGKAAAETGTRSYRAGQAARAVPRKVVQVGKRVQQAGQTAVKGAGRAYEFVREIKAANIGRGLKTGAQATGQGIVTAGKVAGKGIATGARGLGGSLVRGVGSKLIVTELAIASVKATIEAKRLEKDIEALPSSIARANQDKHGRDLGERFERLIKTSETRTVRDELVKQRQTLDSMMLGLAPALEQEGFQYQGQGSFMGIPGVVPEFSADLGLTGGVQEGTINTIRKRRAEIQKQLDKYDDDIVATYNNYVTEMSQAVSDMQARSPDANMSDLENKFNKKSAEMTQFVGDLISKTQGKSIEDISESSNRFVQQGADKLLDDLKRLSDVRMRLDTVPDDQKKEIEAELAQASKGVSLQADLVGFIGGTESVDKVIDQFSQHMQNRAGEEVVAITKQIDSLMQGVNPSKMSDDLKKQVDKLDLKRSNIQFDMDIGDELSLDELDLLGPHVDALKANLAGYADAVRASAIAGPDQKSEIEMLIAGLENSVTEEMTKIGHIFGDVPALGQVTKAIQESQAISKQKIDEQNAKYKQRIGELKTLGVDAAPVIKEQIQSEIDAIQAKMEAVPDALAKEFESIKERAAKSIVDTAPKVAEEVSGKGVAEQAKKHGNVIERLDKVLGKDIDIGNFNMAEIKAAQDSANAIYDTWQKHAQGLKETGQLTKDQQVAMWKAAKIVQTINQAETDHRAATEQNDRKRQEIFGKQKMVQDEIAGIRLPVKEADALRKIEEDRGKGVGRTNEQLEAEIPKVLKISNLRKKALKRDGAKAPERKEGQPREQHLAEVTKFKAKRETESQLAADELKDIFGKSWFPDSAKFANVFDSAMGKGTQTPGHLDRGIERIDKATKGKERESAQLQANQALFDAGDAFADMPSSVKDVIRSSSQVISPGQAAGAGGIAGAIGALLSDDKSLDNIVKKALGKADQATILQGALGTEGGTRKATSIEQALKIKTGRQQIPQQQGKSALPGGMPIFTAVDTDEFTRPVDVAQEAREKYGARAEPMLRRAQDVKEIEERIKKVDRELKGPKAGAERGGFGTGPKDLHGFEISGVTKGKRGGQRRGGTRTLMSIERREKLKNRRDALDAVKKKKFAEIEKMVKNAEEAGGVKQSQGEKDRLNEQVRKQQAAEEKFGTGYTGDAPERVTKKGGLLPPTADLPPGVLPKTPQTPPETGPQAPGTVRGKQAPIRAKTGVSDPTKVRQLAHGSSGGSFANKGRGIKQILQQAGSMIEEMGTEMDRFNEDQDNITQYKGNRLFNIQAVSRS